VDLPASAETVLQAARDNIWLRLVVASAVGGVCVFTVTAVSKLWGWWKGRSARHERAARALSDQGEYHVQLKHRHEALELFDLSVQLNPTQGHVYYLRGCLHAELGDPNRAIADWRRCVARLPRHRDAQRRLAQLGQYAAQPIAPRWGYLWGAVAILLLIALVGLTAR
jgi:tetratricopeptide (TPR) repeat protein